MRKRLFIAINLDERMRAAIEHIVDEIQEKMPPDILHGIRFAPPQNWHLTLSFLGYQDDDALRRIADAAQIAAAKFPAQEIVFKKIVYGPPGRGPRMIWLLTDKDTEKKLSEIKILLEDELESAGVPFGRGHRPLTGHLTLARFARLAHAPAKQDEIRKENLPPIEYDLNIAFEAAGLDLMESKLRRGGAEYAVLQKFRFK